MYNVITNILGSLRVKRKLSLLPVAVFGLLMAAGTVHAQIPEIISYQGVDPTNLSTTITVTATLYDAATGGASAWSETNMPTTDANGMFMILLGANGGTPALGTLDWSQQYWLELDINGTIISPRTQLTTSPYAFEAGEALSVADGSITAASLSGDGNAPTDGQVLTFDAAVPGSLKWSTVSGGGGGAIDAIVAGPGVQVTTAGTTVTVGLSANGITGSMIADGAINTQHLAPGAVVSSQIASFAVLTQHIGPQQVTLPKINSQGANSGEAIMFNGTQLIYGNPTPGGPAGGELSGTYPNPIVADNVIDGANVIDESLTGADILNESIGVDDIGPDAVGTSEIINESIQAEDIDTSAVTTSEILNETILAEDIATGAVTTDEILNETILSEDIMDGTIQTNDMQPGNPWTALMTDGFGTVIWDSINTQTIADETILAEDIATGAVTTDEILNETILSEDIMDGQVMTVDIADLAVTNQKVGPDAITTDKILNGEVMNPDIATDAVDSRTIQNETIVHEDIAVGAVRTDEILNETILAEDIATGAVTTDEILDGTVSSTDIMNETILAEDIAMGAVTTDEILNETILADDIATGAVTTDEILDGTVSSTDIMNETILAEDIATGAVTTDEILNNTIINEDLATGAVDSRVILDESVVSGDILNETILAEDIATGAVTTAEILNNTILNEDVATGAINSRTIEDESVASVDILNETIVAADIATGGVTTDEILNATILEEDIAPSGPTNPGGTDFLQTNGATVFWGPPALGSIPVSALTPGVAHQVVTTNAAGTLAEWDFIETANVFDLAITNPKIAANAITTDKILDGTILPIDIMPSAINTQVLKTVAGTVVWADDALSLPFSGTDATNADWSFEVIKTGTALGAIRGVVNNGANGSAGVMGETNGTGPAVRGLATAGGAGGSFESQGAGAAIEADATGAGNGIEVRTNGGNGIEVDANAGGSGIVVDANDVVPGIDVFQAGNGDALYAETNGLGFAVQGIQSGGAGGAGHFETTDNTNASEALTVTAAGPIPNGSGVFRSTLQNGAGGGWAGVFDASASGDGNGVFIETDDAGDEIALHLERGGLKLSYSEAAGAYTVQGDDIAVYVQDDGIPVSAHVITLPAFGEDGQIIWILNGDVDPIAVGNGTLLGPVSHATTAISGNRGMGFVYSATEAAWIPAGNM